MLKQIKPITNGRRGTVLLVKPKKNVSLKALTKKLSVKSGRNNRGVITVRHKSGGAKKLYRVIDFKRNNFNIEGVVKQIEYDPNRNAFIALVFYKNGDKRYILAPKGLEVGSTVISAEKTPIEIGNSMKIENIPEGTEIHNIELNPNKGGVIARSAGNYATVMSFDKKYCQLRLPSGEIRLVLKSNYATIGQVSNADFVNVKIGKAGRSRHLGIKPTVRGVAMHPFDHPHGGGEGRGGTGGPSKDVYGNVRLRKTRKNKRTQKFIISSRKNKK